MAQHDYVISNASGSAVRSDLNNALSAIATQNSGSSEPTTTYAYMKWADTTAGVMKMRNGANNAWITLHQLDGEYSTIPLENGSATAPPLYFKNSGTDTGIFSPGTDQFGIATAGVERVEYGTSEVVFNDGGADYDFRIEGDTNPNLFKIDAGLDQVQVANLNGGPLAGMRNKIVNGNFDIWQRGTNFTPTNNGFTADRWFTTFNGSGSTRAITREEFFAGSTVPPGAAYFLKYNQSVAGSGATFNTINQQIEDVRTFGGQTVTLSFYARGFFQSLVLPAITLRQNFGAGGSSFVDTSFASNTLISGGTYNRYSFVVTVPSITNKVVGTSSCLELIIDLPLNTTFIFELAGVQLEPGTVATPFEQRSYGQELGLCQRYFTSGRYQWIGYQAASNIAAETTIPISPPMRVAPTVSISNSFRNAFNAEFTNVIATNYFSVRALTSAASNFAEFVGTYTASAEL